MSPDQKPIKFLKGNSFTYFTEEQFKRMTKRQPRHGWVREGASQPEEIKVIIPKEVLEAKEKLTQKFKEKENHDAEILGTGTPVDNSTEKQPEEKQPEKQAETKQPEEKKPTEKVVKKKAVKKIGRKKTIKI